MSMINKFYKKAREFVIDVFPKDRKKGGNKHFTRTVYWVKALKPKADEALLIAAFAHDIERAFGYKNSHQIIDKSDQGFTDKDYLTVHQKEGARIMGDYLLKIGADKKMISRVKMLIVKHEVGGNTDQNLLMDADSISFFENNVDNFVKNKVGETSKEKVKNKFDWMYNRITSKKAKQIAKPWYDRAIKKLGY